MADVWSQLAAFATRIDRYDLALDAYKHYIALKPAEPTRLSRRRRGAAQAAQARRGARARGARRRGRAPNATRVARGGARDCWRKIALARHDAEARAREAALARESRPDAAAAASTSTARLLYDQGSYDEALPLFEQAIAELQEAGGAQLIAELHFYAGDTLGTARALSRGGSGVRRGAEASSRRTPAPAAASRCSIRRPAAPDDAATDARRHAAVTPTPETYALAARLYTMFGNRQRAEAVRAEARARSPTPNRAPRRRNDASQRRR